MLLDPLTPPQDHSTPPSGNGTYNGNGVTSSMGSNSHNTTGHSTATEANIFAPTPVSTMGLESREERAESAEHVDSYDSTDEDQDMSDGGAALTIALSHAEALNAELDLLDAEVMGPDNFNGLHLETDFPSMDDEDNMFHYADSFPSSNPYALHSLHSPEAQEDVMEDDPIITPDLPTTMSEVSQHLQHIQDGQEHVELDMAADDQHGTFTNNSTHPFLLPYVPQFQTMQGSAGTQQTADHVSLSALSSAQSTPGIPLQPPLAWSNETPAHPTTTNGLMPPQNPQNPSHLSFVDIIWEEESDADQNEVEDQSNLSLGDFLYNWGMSASRNDETRRRNRGPMLPAIHRQRFAENLDPMRRCDLQGELCDIQRINWAELGVSRLEARQMRRQTYINYTNVRLAYQWHVSTVLARLRKSTNQIVSATT
jgi:hypothetical protein